MTEPLSSGVEGIAQPPQRFIDRAIWEARQSPCRSKRGVTIFRASGTLSASGHNHKPRGFDCDGSPACKATCRAEAIHAEQEALLQAGIYAAGADLLHVKVDETGRLVPSGGPSCVECSKLILAAKIAGVWLFHECGWRRYPAAEFHALSLEALILRGVGQPQIDHDVSTRRDGLTASSPAGSSRSQPAASVDGETHTFGGTYDDPPHCRDDYRNVWRSGFRAGRESARVNDTKGSE